jgi:hypothetical protein
LKCGYIILTVELKQSFVPEFTSYNKKLEIIEIISKDEVTIPDFKNTLQAILSLVEIHGRKKVFIDATLVTGYPDPFPIYSFGSLVGDILKGIKIAILTTQERREETFFFQNVVLNHGGIVKYFESSEKSYQWLWGKHHSNFPGF